MRVEYSLDSYDSLDNEVLSRNRTSLVEATNVDATRERNTEWFSAEDGCITQTSVSD